MSAALPDLRSGNTERLVVGAGLVASLVLVWLATRQPLAVAGFGAGLLGLGALAFVLGRPRAAANAPELALPDWSVTVAAIERADAAVAITDRAGRLVCANRCYEDWFGIGNAPPRLAVDNASLERLAKAGRSGWRDGKGQADVIEGQTGRWQASAQRAGRGDDYLVWTLTPLTSPDLVAELVPHLDGKLGRALSQAGIAAAIVDPDGKIRTASAGLCPACHGRARRAADWSGFHRTAAPGRSGPHHLGARRAPGCAGDDVLCPGHRSRCRGSAGLRFHPFADAAG